MKSESGESPKQLLTEPDSAGISDFLYVDRARISALYAQLFPQGTLTSVKTTSQHGYSDDKNVGTDVKVFKAEAKSVESGSEGIEHMFDATWSIPLEVLDRLKNRSLVREHLRGAGLGSVIMADCHLRVIDYASMDNLWEPVLRVVSSEGVPIPSGLTEALRAMPRAIHAHFLTNEGFLWSSLSPAGLTIPASDLTLKYGGSVSGVWKLLYILDTWPDAGEPPDVTGWSAGQMIDGILSAMHGLRTLMGRPSGWFGITPLMIFRNVSGWRPTPS
jgi:GNAT superfamily N-acetyltransferase